MSINNRAPQVTTSQLMEWLKTTYAVNSGPTYPQYPSNGDFFYITSSPAHYAQWQSNISTWVDLGPSTGFALGNLPTGTNPIQLYDIKSTGFANLFVVQETDTGDPLLVTDRGFIIKKDLMAGGFLNSGQGTIWLNYGLVGKPTLASPPVIQLMSSSIPYPSGTQFPDPSPGWYEAGQLFNLTSDYYWPHKSNTYQAGKYRWEGGQDGDWIKGDYTGHYDTLYLCKDNLVTPAHLDLGNLTVHGYAQFNNDAKLMWVNTSTLAVEDANGVTANAALDVGSIFINNILPLNSGSPAGITISCPLSIGGSRGTSGQVLTSNGSASSPTWQTLSAWNGGTITGGIKATNNTHFGFGDAANQTFPIAAGMWSAQSSTYGGLVFLSDNWSNQPIFSWYGSRNGNRLMGLDASGNLTLTGYLSVTSASGVTFNNDAKLVWANTSVLEVQTSGGALGYLDVAGLYTQNLLPIGAGVNSISVSAHLNPSGNYALGDGTNYWHGVVSNNYYLLSVPAITAAHSPLAIATNGQIGYVASSRKYKENIRNLTDCSWLYSLTPVDI
jgi:hypothetical protein